MPKTITFHGFTITYEDNSYEGVKYLRDDLDSEEARVFFDQARMRGYAKFEDDDDRQYTLFYKSGIYNLVRR